MEYKYHHNPPYESGNEIYVFQDRLNYIRNTYHYGWDHINADGVFGRRTRNAVKGFQGVFMGQVGSGDLDERTQSLINSKYYECQRGYSANPGVARCYDPNYNYIDQGYGDIANCTAGPPVYRPSGGNSFSETANKAPKGGESVIYRASDGGYYEKRGKGEPQPIEVPFDVPDSWEWVRLKSLGEIIGGGTPKTHDSSLWSTEEDGIPWITPADMKNVRHRRVSHGDRYLSDKGLSGSSAQLMPAGTVVMSSRAPIGYLAIADCQIATNQGFKSIAPTIVKTNEWILLALDALMDDIKRRASGTTFKEISGSEFGETLVPLPPLPEQERIIALFERAMAANS